MHNLGIPFVSPFGFCKWVLGMRLENGSPEKVLGMGLGNGFWEWVLGSTGCVRNHFIKNQYSQKAFGIVQPFFCTSWNVTLGRPCASRTSRSLRPQLIQENDRLSTSRGS